MIAALDIERRRPVWAAMSELFLDTELEPADLEHIAAVLRVSGYGAPELREILRREVAPAFGPNLLGVAGVWAGWDEREVEQIIGPYPYRREGPVRWLAGWIFARMIAGRWRRVEPLLNVVAPPAAGDGHAMIADP